MYLLSASFHPSHNRLQCILTLLSLNIFSCLLPRKIIISFNIFYDCVVKRITFPKETILFLYGYCKKYFMLIEQLFNYFHFHSSH